MGRIIYIASLALLYVLFVMVATNYALPILPLFNWGLPTKLVLVIVPLYLVYLWRHRQQMISLDFRVFYITILVWYVAALALGGGGKSMSNGLIESEIVVLLLGLYLLRFKLSANEPSRAKVVGQRLMFLIIGLAILTTLLVPDLPE